MTKKGQSGRSILSFKDIQIAYLLEGMPAVLRLVKGRKNVAPLLRRALKELQKAKKSTDVLETFIEENYSAKTRGRTVPELGQERVYKAQKLETGGAFLRLPLTPLGTRKGGHVRVRFERDRIIVENK